MERLSGSVLALAIEDGVDGRAVEALRAALHEREAHVHLVSAAGRSVRASDGMQLEVHADVRAVQPHYYDGVLILRGTGAGALEADPGLVELLRELHEAGCPLGAWGEAAWVLARAGLSGAEPGVVVAGRETPLDLFLAAFGREVASVRRRDRVETSLRGTFPASDAPGGGTFI